MRSANSSSGRHELTLFGVGYYGFSYVPGLIPINTFVPDDTVDRRQLDRTHTSIFVASDTWRISDQKQLTFSGFFRTYSLKLRSNFAPDFTQSLEFPGGLIQQSEVRTVAGGGLVYVQKIRPWISLLSGLDLRRDAPRGLDLNAANAQGVFEPVTSNNLTLSFVEPYAALDGALGRYFHYDVGIRREEIWMDNQDLINPQNSSTNSPASRFQKQLSQFCQPKVGSSLPSPSAMARRFTPKTRASAPGPVNRSFLLLRAPISS